MGDFLAEKQLRVLYGGYPPCPLVEGFERDMLYEVDPFVEPIILGSNLTQLILYFISVWPFHADFPQSLSRHHNSSFEFVPYNPEFQIFLFHQDRVYVFSYKLKLSYFVYIKTLYIIISRH